MYGELLALHQVLAGNYVTRLFIYMLGTTIKLSMLFKFWGHSGVHKNILRVRSSCN